MRGRAFTLLETVIGAALAALLLSLMVWVLVPALRVWSRGQARSEVQQSALAVARWVRSDVARAAPQSLLTGPDWLTMSTRGYPMQFDDTGSPRWESFICYRLDADGRVRRQEEVISPPAASASPSPPPVADQRARTVGRHIQTFSPAITGEGRVQLHLNAVKDGHGYELDTLATTVFTLTPSPSP